jgi:hypothetical protein
MIPEKDKYYKIKYTDPHSDLASYVGTARFTGEVEEDSDEQDLTKGFLYVFDDLEKDDTFFEMAFFAEEDIVEEVKD